MKEKILQKALEQFLQFGIREMSNVKLVEMLGISTKTIYKYFKDKEDLLEQAIHLYHDQQYLYLTSLAPDKSGACCFFDVWHYALEIEYQVNHKFFEDLHHYYPDLAKKVEAAIDKKFTEKFLQIIENGINDGSFKREIVPTVVLDSVFILQGYISRTEKFKKYNLPSYEIFLNTIVVYIRGLCSHEGLRQLEEHILSIDPNSKINPKRLSS